MKRFLQTLCNFAILLVIFLLSTNLVLAAGLRHKQTNRGINFSSEQSQLDSGETAPVQRRDGRYGRESRRTNFSDTRPRQPNRLSLEAQKQIIDTRAAMAKIRLNLNSLLQQTEPDTETVQQQVYELYRLKAELHLIRLEQFPDLTKMFRKPANLELFSDSFKPRQFNFQRGSQPAGKHFNRRPSYQGSRGFERDRRQGKQTDRGYRNNHSTGQTGPQFK